jgi:hypothetical protein
MKKPPSPLRPFSSIRLAVDAALLAPALAVRTDFVLEKTARGLAEEIVLRLEDRAFHRGAMRMAPSSRTSSPLK